MKSVPHNKEHCCSVCNRVFTRVDHLKRHQLRHSGVRPYSCIFCEESFARCDNLRDHYTDCAQRGDRDIPETGQRGRRRHACQSCTSMKLRCDGLSPCGSCQKRKLKCNNERKHQNNDHEPDAGIPDLSRKPVRPVGSSKTKGDDYEPTSDRGSIKFLLNGGTDSFTEQFLLPPRSDRARGLEYNNQRELEEAGSSMMEYAVKHEQPAYAPSFATTANTTALSFFSDGLFDFINGPFGEPPYAGEIPYQAVIPPAHDHGIAFSTQEPAFEEERPFAIALIRGILERALALNLDPKAHQEISASLSFLLTTARIRKHISVYFKYWQNSCPMLHQASFDPESASLPLLASVTFMGAMYSNDPREAYTAKRLVDFAELFVYSSEQFSCESEIISAFCADQNMVDEGREWHRFQAIQAGFIMITTQYWAGGPAARNRAMEHRFSELVRVARRINLPKCRHLPEDSTHEYLWIQKECRIRTMCMISLLDCAFSFYQNYPCRLSPTEMECDFPSVEFFFASKHPFCEPNFQPMRELNILDTFLNLFEESSSQTGSPSNGDPSFLGYLARLTVLDMFILIHILYAFINTHMTILAPLIRKTQTPGLKHMLHGHGIRRRESGLPDDSTLAAIQTALARWRDHWTTLRNTLSPHEWASMGFYKNGYNFWMVSQLLITKRESVDVVMQMEVKCEDKLEKLKVLLKDDSD